MRLLPDRDWLTKYSPESGDLVAGFYIPALECAVRYDRSTGYFSAYVDVKVAVPCDEGRKPIAGLGLFHEKAGILEDAEGNRLAFSGSINETEFGWKHNWDSFHVFTTWGADGGGGTAHVQAEEDSFQRLWANKTASAIVMDVPAAVRLELLKFLPKDDLPGRLRTTSADAEPPVEPTDPIPGSPSPEPRSDPRRLVWGYIRHAPAWPDGGERERWATSGHCWPQPNAFRRIPKPRS